MTLIWSTCGPGRKMIGGISKYYHFWSTPGQKFFRKIFIAPNVSSLNSCQEAAHLLARSCKWFAEEPGKDADSNNKCRVRLIFNVGKTNCPDYGKKLKEYA